LSFVAGSVAKPAAALEPSDLDISGANHEAVIVLVLPMRNQLSLCIPELFF
jgi:hypothetical protein